MLARLLRYPHASWAGSSVFFFERNLFPGLKAHGESSIRSVFISIINFRHNRIYSYILRFQASEIIIFVFMPINAVQRIFPLLEQFIQPCQCLEVLGIIERFKEHREPFRFICFQDLCQGGGNVRKKNDILRSTTMADKLTVSLHPVHLSYAAPTRGIVLN